MERIASFTVDHTVLVPGLYLYRAIYNLGTMNLSISELLSNSQMHSVEHLIATLLRNSESRDAVIYFGPMGCQTGFYFLYDGDKLTGSQAIALLQAVFARAAEYSGPMPGCSAAECGNYKNLSVEEGRACCAWYRDLIASWTEEKLKYPAK